MKILGSISELFNLVYRKNSQAITLRPSQSVTYTAARDVQLPPQDADAVIVSQSATQTLTNKTLTSPVITTPTGITKADVGLGNVDNTSDATKNSAVATLTNKTLTAPVINSPTGIVKADVGLGNVDNTSNATERAATATLTNKTLTSPVITSPTGIVKADVGLGNVDNTSDATKDAATATLTNKTINGASNTLTVLAATQLSGATPIANGGTGQTSQTAAFNALDPLTTKGDLIVHNGTDSIRVPVGTNNFALLADSAEASGVKWAAVTATGPFAGQVSGSAVAAGNIGEKIASGAISTTAVASTTYVDVTGASITLSAGVWMIYANFLLRVDQSGGGTIACGIYNSANTFQGGNATLKAADSEKSGKHINHMVNISSSTTYKLRIASSGATSSLEVADQTAANDAASAFYAVRIA